MFGSVGAETPWEWAQKRRTHFKTPFSGIASGVATGLVGIALRYAFDDPNWLSASLMGAIIAIIVAAGLPQLESFLIWRERDSILLDEANQRLAELQADAPTPVTVAVPQAETPHAELEFICDRKLGWARLRVTNTGAGALFSATIQPHGLTAGAVEGRQIAAKWELGDAAQQRLARGETRVLRLASVMEVAPGVRGWVLHRDEGEDIRGVERTEFLDVMLVADPDLDEPCRLQFLLQTDGDSEMARVGVDPPLFRTEPQRVTDMRRLLVETAEYVRSIPCRANATAAIHMSLVVKIVVPELLIRAFGMRAPAVYARHLKEGGEGEAQNTCVAFLLNLAQRITADEISKDFPLPVTWTEFYESDPDRQWPEYS
jgi:hypothetical protein